ncbi:hypothetical protein Poly51_08680 [Rubripirellula tenax]|uniref:Uncharacterized protein n=1 Tax=Rubripirellula tenax TaxID=2528015 RepID=A0A5C6FI67_9BACT|nr:hypothetical protein Poly51_08680 [Rubripirellula tenax]
MSAPFCREPALRVLRTKGVGHLFSLIAYRGNSLTRRLCYRISLIRLKLGVNGTGEFQECGQNTTSALPTSKSRGT